MKTNNIQIILTIVRALRNVCAFALLGVLTYSVFGQDTNAPAIVAPTIGSPDWVASLVTKWPWITTMLMVIGVLRVIFKPLFTFLHEVVNATPSDWDNNFLASVENSTVLKYITVALDWIASIKLVNPNAK